MQATHARLGGALGDRLVELPFGDEVGVSAFASNSSRSRSRAPSMTVRAGEVTRIAAFRADVARRQSRAAMAPDAGAHPGIARR